MSALQILPKVCRAHSLLEDAVYKETDVTIRYRSNSNCYIHTLRVSLKDWSLSSTTACVRACRISL